MNMNKFYLKIEEFMNNYRSIINNLHNTPLYKLFNMALYIALYKGPEVPINIIILYIFKILCIVITIIMPLSLVIYSIFMMSNIISKNKEYWWKENRHNYHNSKYDYIKQLFKIIENVVLSQRIFVFTFSSLSFIIIFAIIKFKLPNLLTGDNDSYLYKKYLLYSIVFFILILFIIVIYIIINFRKYNRVYKYNKAINNIYIKYLNKDYLKIICNNFVDKNNLLTNFCNIKNIPTSLQLDEYLSTLNIDSINKDNVDLNDDDNKSTDNVIANKYLSTLITHQWLIFIYENQSYPETKENKMCRELKLDTIMNDKMYNIFYCYLETVQHPFESNIEDNLLKITDYSKETFPNNYKIYMKIIDKYLSINNEMSMNISNIKKEDISEINLLIILVIILILYSIGLFVLPDK